MAKPTRIEEVRGRRSSEKKRNVNATPEPIDPPSYPEKLSYYSNTLNSDGSTRSPWHRKVLLSFDGGGIRGYSSLLILQELMSKIEEIERGWIEKFEGSDENTRMHSLYCVWQNDIVCSKEQRHRDIHHDSRTASLKPHHYFDYIAGTSTGGLSALMLGRLQLVNQVALEQYDIVGNKVFGHPRFHFNGAPWPKYSTKRVEAAFQHVIRNCLDRNGRAGLSEREVTLKAKKDDACRTIVVSHGSDETYPKEDVFLFRSYSHSRPSSDLGERVISQPSQEVPIWEIARATSAAPGYFSEHRIRGYSHTDGGIGANNPVHFCFDEVRQMHEGQDAYLIVSIGTGLPVATTKKKTVARRAGRCLLKEVKNMLRAVSTMEEIVTDSERAHEEVSEIVERTRGGDLMKPPFYYRFNASGIADVALDQWEPRKNGAYTKEKLRRQTMAYLREGEVEKMVRECAGKLVDLRRARSKTERWERFATDIAYECKVANCTALRSDSRAGLRSHLRGEHGVFLREQVVAFCQEEKCRMAERMRSIEELREMEMHLVDEHGFARPAVVDEDVLESLLDEGRMR